MSQAYRERPSSLLGLNPDQRVAAYLVDRAVFVFGSNVQNDIEKSARGTKSQEEADVKIGQAVNRWLGTEAPTKGRYKDPMKW